MRQRLKSHFQIHFRRLLPFFFNQVISFIQPLLLQPTVRSCIECLLKIAFKSSQAPSGKTSIPFHLGIVSEILVHKFFQIDFTRSGEIKKEYPTV